MTNRHDLLLKDLRALLAEAEAFEFHDFKNSKYAAPKMMLVEKLTIIADAVKAGRYDD